MTLRASFWNANDRLQQAADNAPAMRQGEPNREAVVLLQRALVDTGVAPDIQVDGLYGPRTAGGVASVETRFNMDRDQGVAGRQSLGILDILLQGGRLGAELARSDTTLAVRKVRAAISALVAFKASPSSAPAVTVDALHTHFRLDVGVPTIGVTRQITDADVDTILERLNQLLGLYGAAATRFRTGVPVNGILTAAEAPLNGPVTFGPAFTDVDSNFGDRIGPNSRAAILIHEGVHVFDRVSGDVNIHISEFDPAYDVQPADLSLHNPSSFAGFAAHIDNGGDPAPRFGLGPASRGL